MSGDKTWRALGFRGQVSEMVQRAPSGIKCGEMHLPGLRTEYLSSLQGQGKNGNLQIFVTGGYEIL